MPLPIKITKLDEVDAKYHPLYTEKEGAFYLDENLIIKDDDVSGLKNNNSALKAEKLKLQEELKQYREREAKEQEEALLTEKKYEELIQLKEKSWQEKQQEYEAKLNKAKTTVTKSLLDSTVTNIAAELAGEAAPLLTPHLKERFNVLETEDGFDLQVLDKEGNPTTKEAVIEEFKENPLFQKIIIGRKSSGGGTAGSQGQPKGNEYAKYFDPSSPDYSPMKQIELKQQKPELYASLIKQFDDDPYSAAVPRAGVPNMR